MGLIEEAGKVGTGAVEALRPSPLAIALLLVNVGFLAFTAYVLGQVATNALERNRLQMELATTLIKELRECRSPRSMLLLGKPR